MVIKMNEKIRRLLIEQNPFWKGPAPVDFIARDLFPAISSRMKERQILALCGLRRVGKTTIMRKLISDLLQKHPAPSILYFSFDDAAGIEFRDVIEEARALTGGESRFLFFDEVQKLENWAEKIKILYDHHDHKIVISGSQSLFLKKGMRESLAGRLYTFEISPLNFPEYLRFRRQEALASRPALHDSELKALLEPYLLSGGFPELTDKTDAALIREYIRETIVRRIVFMDMAKIYPIENPSALISILEILIDQPGMIVDFGSFSQELGLSRQTVSKYFDYLEQAHLVRKLYNYSRNRSTSEKRLKRFYPTFLSPALSSRQDEEYFSKIVEAACVLHTDSPYFFRDKYRNEVDIVRLDGKEPVPIEIKYRNQPQRGSALGAFSRHFPARRGIVVTKTDGRNRKEGGMAVSYLPAHQYLLNPKRA